MPCAVICASLSSAAKRASRTASETSTFPLSLTSPSIVSAGASVVVTAVVVRDVVVVVVSSAVVVVTIVVVVVVTVVVVVSAVVVCGFSPVKTEQGLPVSFQPFLPLITTSPQSRESVPPAFALLISRYSTGLPLPYQLHAIQPVPVFCAYSMM